MARRLPRHSFGQSRVRFWVRHEGRVLRFLTVNEQQADGDGRCFIKRISHRRFRPGQHLAHGRYTPAMAQWYADLPADTWTEVVLTETQG
jgi:hypothetical protein